MKKQNYLKSMLCLLLGLVCHVAWAQTYTHTKQTTAPTDGYYLIYSESSSGKGWIHYDSTLDRKYRVATDVDLSSGVTMEQDKYIWKLVNGENSTFTLQCMDNGTYMPADAGMNKNMSATETAHLAVSVANETEGSWYINQTNYKNGNNLLYIHTNTPGGYPNLSYWENCSADGTSIRAQFYKIDIAEESYTLNYMLGEDKIGTATITVFEGGEVFENDIKGATPEGYYVLDYTLTDNTYTVNVALDTRPIPGKKYYMFNKHQAGYQYYYDNDGSVGFADACKLDDKAYIWLCEANGDKLNFKNVETGKYFAWQALSSNAYGWNVSSEVGNQKVVNEGCVTLQNSSNKYLVGKIGAFDQADVAGYNNTTYSSDFCFVEYTHKPQPGKYYYFYNKHLKGDKFFYDNNGNVGFSATKEAFNKAYIWLCEEDANNPGMVTFKNLSTDRYFVWKGLSTTALAWTVDETVGSGKVVNEGCVTLKANQSGSNVLVVKNATGWDQAGGAGYYNETFSSDFCFEEFSALPQDGQTYFIYNDNDTPLYLNNNNGSLKANEGRHLMDAYLFVCQKYGDTYRFKNLAGKWLAHKSLSDNAHNFTVATTAANAFGSATLWTDNVDAKGGRYLCIKKDGSLDHAQGTFNKSNSDYSTDFVFEPCVETANVLTINLPVYVNATLTVDGTTYTASMSTELTAGVAPVISLTHTNNHFEFVGFVDSEGNTYDTAELANATQDIELTAKFAPTFMSQTYGEKWVRLTNCSNTAYSAGLEVTEGSYDNRKGKTAIMDFSAENQLWCLVGTAESFVLYNKAAGEDYALNVPLADDASYANNTESKMTTDEGTWKLKMGHYGVALVPTAKDNASEHAINMYGGAGGYLKLYTTGKEDKGSYWTPTLIDATKYISVNVTVEGEAWDARHGVARLVLTAGGLSSTTTITGNTAIDKCYLPKDAPFTLTCPPYRGYTFNGFGETYENVTLESSLELEALFVANEERTLYYSPDANGKPYRIPAIAAAPNGHLFAIADNRPAGADIGYGEVDIKCRISTDNGATWGEEFFIADGDGTITTNNMKYGYGDAAVVGDRESNKILVMMVAGHTVCHNGRWDKSKIGNPDADAVNRVARVYGTYNETSGEWEWTEPVEVTDHMYSIFLDGETPTVTSMFIGSGKICQSRVVKKGEYYRLYCAIWTRDGGNRVIYSDDFGGTWNVLGTIADRPASGGDEPKCEELPDGSVILSSRVSGGRWFNIFTFNKDGEYTTGTWGTATKSTSAYDGSGNGTNGEIYKVKAIRKSDGQICDVMLQSIPAGPGRTNVKVYYKEMVYNEDGTNKYTPATFAEGWTVGKHVSYTDACYSTMILQADGRIGFFFEEVPGGYCMVYIPYTLEDLTAGQYSLYTVTSSITDAEIGTFYASEAVQIPEGVKAYVADENNLADGVITMTQLEDIIPAHTGAVLRGEADSYEFIPSISYGTPVEGNLLVGHEAANSKDTEENRLSVEVDNTASIYVLANDSEGMKFYKKSDNFTVKNNKAYLRIPNATLAQSLRIRFAGEEEGDGGTTSIDEGQLTIDNGQLTIYDLQSRRVLNPTKGMYIVNGKKIVIK